MSSAAIYALPSSSVAPVTASGPAGRDFLPTAVPVTCGLRPWFSSAPVHSSLLAERCVQAFAACVDVGANKLAVVDEPQAAFLHGEANKAKCMFADAEKAMFKLRINIFTMCKAAWVNGDVRAAPSYADAHIAKAIALVRHMEASIATFDAAIEFARTGGKEGRSAIYAALRFANEVNRFGDKDFGLRKCDMLAEAPAGRAAAVFIARIEEVCCHQLTRSFAVAMPEGDVRVVDALAQEAFSMDAERENSAFKSLSKQIAAASPVIGSIANANALGDSPSTDSLESKQVSDLWTTSARSSMTSIYSQSSMYSQASSQASIYSQESAAPVRDPRRVPSALLEALGDVLDPLPATTPAPQRRARPAPMQCRARTSGFAAPQVKSEPRAAGRRPIGIYGGVAGGSLRPVVPPPARLVSRAAEQRRAATPPAPAPLPAVAPRDSSEWGAPVGFTLHRGPVGYTMPSQKEQPKGWRKGLKAMGSALKRLGRK
ncbi:hypothetical protein HDZ31DRAFT_60943 [Schizophyllum fasciatum]